MLNTLSLGPLTQVFTHVLYSYTICTCQHNLPITHMLTQSQPYSHIKTHAHSHIHILSHTSDLPTQTDKISCTHSHILSYNHSHTTIHFHPHKTLKQITSNTHTHTHSHITRSHFWTNLLTFTHTCMHKQIHVFNFKFLFIYLFYIHTVASSHPPLIFLLPQFSLPPLNHFLFTLHSGKGRSPVRVNKTWHIKL